MRLYWSVDAAGRMFGPAPLIVIEGLGEIPLSFGMPGRLDEMLKKEMEDVALNEEIAVLNSADLDNQVKQAVDASLQ